MTPNALTPAASLPTHGHPQIGPAELVDAFLASHRGSTRVAYAQALADFARHVGQGGPQAAAAHLLRLQAGEANAAVLGYRNALQAAGKSPATIALRLSALRALARLGRTLGLVTWALEIQSPKAEPYRDTRGPGDAGVRKLLVALEDGKDACALRNRAAIRLLTDLALRRSEVCTLNLEHVDLTAGTLQVRGKGRQGREALTLPKATKAALVAWIAARGPEPGPLFVQLDNARTARRGTRLSSWALWHTLRVAGERLGLRLTPHGLRHAAITRALDLTNGDVRSVQRFSRHRDVRTLTRYDDNREDLAGAIAKQVATW